MLAIVQANAQARAVTHALRTGSVTGNQAIQQLRAIAAQVSATPPAGATALFYSGEFRSLHPNERRDPYDIGVRAGIHEHKINIEDCGFCLGAEGGSFAEISCSGRAASEEQYRQENKRHVSHSADLKSDACQLGAHQPTPTASSPKPPARRARARRGPPPPARCA